MKINILFPFPPKKPAGGTRVLYEYANQLKKLGNDITIYHSLSCSYHVSKTPFLLRFLYFTLFSPPKWFKLEEGIKVKLIKKVCDKEINDGDILLYTWWALSYDLQHVNELKGKKFNLIQDIEFWTGNVENVKESYFLKNINNVVISEHIRRFIQSIRPVDIAKVPFAIDHTKFYIKNPISSRNKFSVCMMYSQEPRKGSKYGIEALEILKRKYPQVIINVFSVFDLDIQLDFSINFYRQPPNLSEIMNDSAIFISPSVQEGCALPPMEAMHCGCAVVCSDIDGHSEYAINNDTALLFESKNVQDLVEKVSFLIDNDEERIRIANQGNCFIRKNTWESSTQELLKIFKGKS